MRTPSAAIVALAAVFWSACSAPSDSADYDYTSALGAACDAAHPCGEDLVCRVPHECRRVDPAILPPPSAVGGRAGDGCDPARPCAEGHVCEPLSEVGVCTRDCAAAADCPGTSTCWLDRGPAEGWCLRPGGLLGARCSFENDCAPGLFCENRADGGYCTKSCDAGIPCPAGMDAICTRLSGDFGNYCLQRCTADHDACRDDLSCRKMTKADEYVCFPRF